MQDTPKSLRPIPPFMPGDQRTPLSAAAVNELVRALNQLILMRAGPGLVLTKAEAGWVISVAPDQSANGPDDPNTTPQGNPNGGGGTVNFQGYWFANRQYRLGDVVIRPNPDDFENGDAGTFIAKRDNINAPPPALGAGQFENDDWGLFSQSQVPTQWFLNANDALKYTKIDKEKITVSSSAGTNPNVGSSGEFSPYKIQLAGHRNTLAFDAAQQYAAYGLTFSPIGLQICQNGVTRTLWLLGMLV